MQDSTQALDHLILFLPPNPSTNLPEVPAFFNDNFTLSPGGFHADGATSNVLILLADGCYIELISFIKSDAIPSHWWGGLNGSFVGWKDWCLTNNKSPEANYEGVHDMHTEPVHGGRKRADGVDVKWAVTFPKGDHGGQHSRGRVPFFCHDITPRNVRVPIDNGNTTHSSGSLGVQELTVIVKDQALLDETQRAYRSILGSDGSTTGNKVFFHTGRVHEVSGLFGRPKITLRLPENEEEANMVEKNGFLYGNVVLGAKAPTDEVRGTKKRIDDPGHGTSVGGIWVEYV